MGKYIFILTILLFGCAPPQPYQQKYYTNTGSSYNSSSNNELRSLSIKQAQTISESNEVVRNISDEKLIEIASSVTADGLKDPSSAQFRRVNIKNYNGNRIVCGEVNGKNSYGGYVGFRKFMAGVSGFFIEETSSKYPEINRDANAGLTLACK